MRRRLAVFAFAVTLSSVAVSSSAAAAAHLNAVATGAGPGGGPHVKVFDVATGLVDRQFFAYDTSFLGGVHVAMGDVDGDGFGDIVTGPGPGGGPHVKVFSGKDGALIEEFFTDSPGFTGGLYVAAADVNGDGKAEVITGAGEGGGPHVEVFDLRLDAKLTVANFYAYEPSFTGGVRVAAADLDGDGKAEVVTGAGPGGGPHVRGFKLGEIHGSIPTPVLSMYPEDPAYAGGVFVGASVDGDHQAHIVTTPGVLNGGSPYARVFTATGTQIGQVFFQYGEPQPSGWSVAMSNADADAVDEITGGQVRNGSLVVTKKGYGDAQAGPVFAATAYPGFSGGVSVAMGRI